jgi:hypothetical protein
VLLLGVLAAWFAFVFVWALRPVSDAVPTGTVDNQHTTQTVSCSAPLSSEASVRGSLPPLPAGREYERQPCVEQHHQYRLLFWLDTAFVLLAACGVMLATRPRLTQHRAEPTDLVPAL